MAEHPKHALWFRPFGETAFKLKERIKKLAERYDTPIFEPHITLVSDLHQSRTELIQLTDTLAGAMSQFTVELAGIGFRDHYYQALFYHVKNTPDFKSAHKTAGRFFGYNSDEGYFPHLSLLYGNINRVEKRKLLNTMNRSEHIRFPVHSILLIKTEGDVPDWKKIHTAEFGHK